MRPHFPGRTSFSSLLRPGVILTMLFLSCGPAIAGGDTDSYRIEPQTKLKVTIVEWIASTGEYKEWTALNGEYVVSAKGKISVPMIGEIKVSGELTDDVETAIGNALKQRTGLSEVPVATVEVTRYPMVYVTGAVDRSGEFEFRPGLTVLQAVALAGGRERKQIPTGGYSEADQIRYFGELNRFQLQLKQLIARRARLQAEVNGEKQPEVPDALSGNSPVDKRIVDDERQLFLARTEDLQHHLDSLNELGNLLKGEIQVLEEKKLVQDRQVGIAEEELKVISRLVSTKTLARSQESSSERMVAELRSSMLDLVVQSMRAKQKLSETERDALTLKGQFIIDARRQMQAAEAEIEDTKLKRDTMLQVLQITGASLSKVDNLKAIELQPMEYWITRGGGEGQAIQASQSTVLQPRDVLEVRLGLTADTAERAPVAARQTQ